MLGEFLGRSAIVFNWGWSFWGEARSRFGAFLGRGLSLVGDGARSFVGDEERDRFLGSFWGETYRVLGRFWREAVSLGGDGVFGERPYRWEGMEFLGRGRIAFWGVFGERPIVGWGGGSVIGFWGVFGKRPIVFGEGPYRFWGRGPIVGLGMEFLGGGPIVFGEFLGRGLSLGGDGVFGEKPIVGWRGERDRGLGMRGLSLLGGWSFWGEARSFFGEFLGRDRIVGRGVFGERPYRSKG